MHVAIRAFVYVVVGLGVLVGYIPALIADMTPGPLFFPGLAIGGIGAAIYCWTVWTFVTVGRGTPVPIDPPRTLVIRGLYRVVRNPMAIGFLLIFVGEAVAFGALTLFVYTAGLFLAIYLFIVFVEEPGLKRRYGASYEAYHQSVPRWLPHPSALRQLIRDARRPPR